MSHDTTVRPHAGGAAGGRRRVLLSYLALASLTLGGFAIGSSEFAAMGMLPSLAKSVLPTMAAAHPDVAAAQVSVFVWGYALGVVIGAPLFGSVAPRFRPRVFLVGSLGLMCVLTAATAAAGSFPWIIALRAVAGFPHGAYFGVAAMAAARLMGRRHESRGVAVVLGGLTLANLAGAPAGTWIAQHLSWRATYLGVAAMFAVAAIGVACTLRAGAPAGATARRRTGGLWNGTLWYTVGGFALLNAAFFAVLTFIAPVSTGPGRLAASSAVWVLAAAGLGMTVGNYVGGALADRRPRMMIPVTIATGVAAYAAFAVAPAVPGAFFVAFLLVGGSLGFVAPYTQVRLMRTTPTNPQLGSSMNSVCGNIGSAAGGMLAGIAVGGTGSASAAVVVGAALLVCGAASSALLMRRSVVPA